MIGDRWLLIRRWALDLLPCLPFLPFVLAGTYFAWKLQQGEARRPHELGFLLAAAALLSIALRRRLRLSMIVNSVVIAGYLAAGYPYGPILLTALPLIYLAALRWTTRRAALAATGVLAVILGGTLAKEIINGRLSNQILVSALAFSAIAAAALSLGTAVRVSRESIRRVRAEQAQRAASEERLRMAQDLHDTIGHGLAVIAMQAGVALHVFDRNPEQARESMEAVKATSREALDNLRAQLDSLRSPDRAEARRPAAGIADLARLVDRVRAGGVGVSVDIDPALRALPGEVDAAAYRIVQESLTNVLRHANATQAWISVRAEEGTLLLDVTDSGPAATAGRAAVAMPPGGGSGIRGMRAQAEALGGTLRAQPRPGGGFAVSARLPLRGRTRLSNVEDR